MLGENPGDVVVDYDYLVDLAVPLFSEHSDGGRTAADAHAFFLDAINYRRLASFHNHGRAFIDFKFHWLSVAQVQQSFTSNHAFTTAASGEMANAAQREHLRTV